MVPSVSVNAQFLCVFWDYSLILKSYCNMWTTFLFSGSRCILFYTVLGQFNLFLFCYCNKMKFSFERHSTHKTYMTLNQNEHFAFEIVNHGRNKSISYMHHTQLVNLYIKVQTLYKYIHWLGPLCRVSHRVAMSVGLSARDEKCFCM